jgi:hypothetical protein
MSSARHRRSRQVEARLSPRQVVLLALEEAHQHGSMAAYAAHLIDSPAPMTLCQQIEAAVVAAHHYRDEVVRNRVTREAQRGALFLAHLAGGCEESVVGSESEDLTRLVLAHTLLENLGLQFIHDEPTEPQQVEGVGSIIDSVSVRAEGLVQAVALIEQTHFDGHAVLFPRAGRGWCGT